MSLLNNIILLDEPRSITLTTGKAESIVFYVYLVYIEYNFILLNNNQSY